MQFDDLYEQACSTRERVLDELGFDLFESGTFSEYLVCQLCNAKQTSKPAKPDAILYLRENGGEITVEVKHSSGWPGSEGEVEYDLKGTRKRDIERKGVDILVGVLKEDLRLRFYVLPLHELNNGSSLQPKIIEQRQRKSDSIHKYEVGPSDLRMAIVKAYDEKENYQGLATCELETENADTATLEARERASRAFEMSHSVRSRETKSGGRCRRDLVVATLRELGERGLAYIDRDSGQEVFDSIVARLGEKMASPKRRNWVLQRLGLHVKEAGASFRLEKYYSEISGSRKHPCNRYWPVDKSVVKNVMAQKSLFEEKVS